MSTDRSESFRFSQVVERIKTESSLHALLWPYAISAASCLFISMTNNKMMQVMLGCSFALFSVAIIFGFFYALMRRPDLLRSEAHQYNMHYLQLMKDDRTASTVALPEAMSSNTHVHQVEFKP